MCVFFSNDYEVEDRMKIIREEERDQRPVVFCRCADRQVMDVFMEAHAR